MSWEPWEPNSFDAPSQNAAIGATKRVTAAKAPGTAASADATVPNQAARESGYRDGFDAGRSDGLAAGREEAQAEARNLALQLGGAIKSFDDGVASLEKEVAQELLNLALGIARRIVGDTLEAKPEVVLATIREAIAQLPAQHAAIHLNSQDADLIRTQMGDTLGRAGHRIHESPQLARGDVLVEAGGTHVDARLETRWQRVWDALEPEPVASRGGS